jgi:uroporphyrinogen decarboxylase
MNSRECVINTFKFLKTGRTPSDLMENKFPDQLREYFKNIHGITDEEKMLQVLGADCRWINIGKYPFFTDIVGNRINKDFVRAESESLTDLTVSDAVFIRPLANASVEQVESLVIPEFDKDSLPDFKALKDKWSDYAVILSSSAPPLFMSACEVFGFEETLVKMIVEPDVFEAFIKKLHKYNMDVLTKELNNARGYVDICRLWDDVASQENLIMNPNLWRKYIKPYLAEEIALIHEYGMFSLYHECGNIRPILPDFIEIGLNGLEVFQTTAQHMDAESIAKDFGGKIVFYGGIDVQALLTKATPDEVRKVVRSNIKAFENCGGYIVANSHNGTDDIKNENVIAMFHEVALSNVL